METLGTMSDGKDTEEYRKGRKMNKNLAYIGTMERSLNLFMIGTRKKSLKLCKENVWYGAEFLFNDESKWLSQEFITSKVDEIEEKSDEEYMLILRVE